MHKTLLAIGLGLLTLGLGCGGNGYNTTSTVALKAIKVTAPNTNAIVGQTEQLTASGTYTDNTTKDLTASVTWSSSSNNIAQVAAGGLLTAQSSGTVTITATSSSVSGAIKLTIAPKLVAISINPA